MYPSLSLPEIYISTTWDHKASLMLISTVGELAMGNCDEVWALNRTSIILVVRLSKMDSIVVFGGCISLVESAMDFE